LLVRLSAISSQLSVHTEGRLLRADSYNSHPSQVGRPYVLMQLHLEPYRELIGQDPLCQLTRSERAEDRAEVHRTAGDHPILSQNLSGPVIVSSIGQDKFHLVFGEQTRQIRPVHSIRHPASRTLNIEDDMRAGIDRRNIDSPAGLKKNSVAFIAESGHEGEALGLYKRFPSCDLHKGTPIVLHLCQDLIDRALLPS